MEGLERVSILAKQVLSQLSYTPTKEVPFILKHLPRFQNPFLRIFIETVYGVNPKTETSSSLHRSWVDPTPFSRQFLS